MLRDTPPQPAPAAAPTPTRAAQPSKQLTLLVLALTGLMLILDLTITNVALPTIQRALQMTPQGLQWVVNAYALAYGGFLLLGGRLADRLGRRRVFLAGVAVFTVASLIGGLAPSAGVLIAARALQGLGAALAGPASLSIITTTFAEGPQRNRALGVWSAVVASGGAIGMLAGGLLTQYASWRWVLFVNVPVGALLLAATPRVVPATPGELRTRIDAAGAVTVTAGLAALVFATTQVPGHGWASPRTLGVLLAAAVLLGAFLVIESRHRAPLVPLRILGRRSLAGADTVALLGGAAVIASPIFFLTLYLQQILGLSAMAAGLALAAVGLVLLGRIHPAGSYPVDVLGPVVLLGLGMGLSFVPLTASAVAGVPHADQGLASGLLQTAQQLGVALGLAVLTTLATATTQGLLSHPAGPPDPAALQAALTGGYAAALRGAALLALAAAAVALLVLPPPRPMPIQPQPANPKKRA